MSINITLIAQVLAFIALIWLVNKYMWAPISMVLEERRKKIADGLAASEKGQEDMKQAEERAENVLIEAKSQASEIIAQATSRSSQIVDEAKQKAQEEAARIKAAANAELDQEINRAKESLRAKVSELAVTGASKILGKEIDANSHKGVLDDLVSKL